MIALFSNNIKENEFARLFRPVPMSVSQVVAMIGFSKESNLLYPKQRRCYQLKAEMTNVVSCQIAVGLISGFP